MRKPAFCICENKAAVQLRGYRKADQGLCFRYIESTVSLLSKSEIFKPLAIFCGYTAGFVSDLTWSETPKTAFLVTWLIFLQVLSCRQQISKVLNRLCSHTDLLISTFIVCSSASEQKESIFRPGRIHHNAPLLNLLFRFTKWYFSKDFFLPYSCFVFRTLSDSRPHGIISSWQPFGIPL